MLTNILLYLFKWLIILLSILPLVQPLPFVRCSKIVLCELQHIHQNYIQNFEIRIQNCINYSHVKINCSFKKYHGRKLLHAYKALN